MPFPEEKSLELWPHSSQHVVSIHYDMNKRVDHTNEGAMTPRVVLGGPPGDHRHHRVVVHMQKCYLPFLLPDDEEDGVKEFRYFRQEVNVDAAGNLKGRTKLGLD